MCSQNKCYFCCREIPEGTHTVLGLDEWDYHNNRMHFAPRSICGGCLGCVIFTVRSLKPAPPPSNSPTECSLCLQEKPITELAKISYLHVHPSVAYPQHAVELTACITCMCEVGARSHTAEGAFSDNIPK